MLRLKLAALVMVVAVTAATAQTFPNKPIRMVVPFPPGRTLGSLEPPGGEKVSGHIRSQCAPEAPQPPGGVSSSCPGPASPPHLAGGLFARAANVPMVHVPYKGTAPAIIDLVAGQIPAMMAPLNSILPYLKSGRA